MNAHIGELNMEVDVDVGLKGKNASAKSSGAGADAITQGSLWIAIWTLSWPLFLNMVTIAFASFADIWVAGKLGSEAQAAVGATKIRE